MKIVKPGYEILSPVGGSGTGFETTEKAFLNEAKLIEKAGRTAYKSEDKITEDSYDRFIRGIIARNHGAVIEFGSMAVKLVTDRGIAHEIVRHRLCSFVQESTRYCNYSGDKFGGEISFIQPVNYAPTQRDGPDVWEEACGRAEKSYIEMLKSGYPPQVARSVLPNSLKAEIVMRANFREWRHIFRIRAIEKAAHPDMRALMIPLYLECRKLLPCVFDMGDPE